MNSKNNVTTLSSILCTTDIPECEVLNGLECYVTRKIAMLLTNKNSDFFFIFIPIQVASLEICVSQNREK